MRKKKLFELSQEIINDIKKARLQPREVPTGTDVSFRLHKLASLFPNDPHFQHTIEEVLIDICPSVSTVEKI